jgi:anti-anti-sigma factor
MIMTLNGNEVTGVLKISGTLDIDAANSLREALLDCFVQQHDIAADLSDVDGCDAAGLQVLLAGRKDAVLVGKAFRIIAASSAVMETAAALGFLIDDLGKGQGKEHADAT